MEKIEELLHDTRYLADLVNGPCMPHAPEVPFVPVHPEWIDHEASASVTEAFRRLLPEEMPYKSSVLVERNPDTLYGGACVDENKKRQRYVVVSIVPDAEAPYNYSFPLIHAMWMVSLGCWETVRATLVACRQDMQVRIVTEPKPPILNNARLDWVSLYLGRKPYEGCLKLSEQRSEAENEGKLDCDVHLLSVRALPPDPLLHRLLEAYDAEYPPASDLR